MRKSRTVETLKKCIVTYQEQVCYYVCESVYERDRIQKVLEGMLFAADIAQSRHGMRVAFNKKTVIFITVFNANWLSGTRGRFVIDPNVFDLEDAGANGTIQLMQEHNANHNFLEYVE